MSRRTDSLLTRLSGAGIVKDKVGRAYLRRHDGDPYNHAHSIANVDNKIGRPMNISEIQDIVNLQGVLAENGALPEATHEAPLLAALIEWRDSTMHSGLVAGDPPVTPDEEAPKAKRGKLTAKAAAVADDSWEPTPDPASESTDSDDEPGF